MGANSVAELDSKKKYHTQANSSFKKSTDIEKTSPRQATVTT